MQIRRAAARDLHGHVGTVPRFGLANLHMHHPMLTTDALLPGEHEERLGPWMRMHGRNAAGRTAGFIDAKEILGCGDAGIGPTSVTFVPPAEEPPAGPRVTSHTLPADSATSDQGPAAACACASASTVSIRQKSGPAGKSWSFFSASGLMTSGGCPIATADNNHDAHPNTRTGTIRVRLMWAPHWLDGVANSTCAEGSPRARACRPLPASVRELTWGRRQLAPHTSYLDARQDPLWRGGRSPAHHVRELALELGELPVPRIDRNGFAASLLRGQGGELRHAPGLDATPPDATSTTPPAGAEPRPPGASCTRRHP